MSITLVKNDKTVELLCKMIPKVGFNVPLVIDERGIIVKGHARFTAAIRLGMVEIPCIITHADEEAIKADRIADNKISEFSEWIDDELIKEIENLDFDLSDIGLSKPSLDDVPSVESVEAGLQEQAQPHLSDAQRKQLFEEFKEKQARREQDLADGRTPAPDPVAEEFESTAYYKCVCDKCGYTMFFKEGEI